MPTPVPSVKRVLYFTAGNVTTTDEAADIAAITKAIHYGYELYVRNSQISTDTGTGPEAANYVAGSVPDDYSGAPVFDIDNPPSNPFLPTTQAVVSNGQALTVPVTGTYTDTATVTVANGAVTGIELS